MKPLTRRRKRLRKKLRKLLERASLTVDPKAKEVTLEVKFAFPPARPSACGDVARQSQESRLPPDPERTRVFNEKLSRLLKS